MKNGKLKFSAGNLLSVRIFVILICFVLSVAESRGWNPPPGRMMRKLKTTVYTDFTGTRYGKDNPSEYDIEILDDRDKIRADIAKKTVEFLHNFVEGFDIKEIGAEIQRNRPKSKRDNDPLTFLPQDVQIFVDSIGGLDTTYVLQQESKEARKSIEPAKILFMVKAFLGFAPDLRSDLKEKAEEDIKMSEELIDHVLKQGKDSKAAADIVDMNIYGLTRKRYYQFATEGARDNQNSPGRGPVKADHDSYIDNLTSMKDYYTQGVEIATCSCGWQGSAKTTLEGQCPKCKKQTTIEKSFEPPNHISHSGYKSDQVSFMDIDEATGEATVPDDGTIFASEEYIPGIGVTLAQRPLSSKDLDGENPYGAFGFDTSLSMFQQKTDVHKLLDPSTPINDFRHRLGNARQCIMRVHYFEQADGWGLPDRPGAVQIQTRDDVLAIGHDFKIPEAVEYEWIDIPYDMHLFSSAEAKNPDATIPLEEQLKTFEKMVDAFQAPVTLPPFPHFPTLTPPGPPGVYTTRVIAGPVQP
jgi:hypothetical protein